MAQLHKCLARQVLLPVGIPVAKHWLGREPDRVTNGRVVVFGLVIGHFGSMGED